MSSDGKNDPWAELLLGSARLFADPQPSDAAVEQAATQPAKRKADAGYVMVNMDALVVAGGALNVPGLLILLEAARQWRMGNGAVAVTTAFGTRLGLTDKQRRGAVAELAALADTTGWVKVTQYGKAAARVHLTTTGMRKLWRARSGIDTAGAI